MELLNESVSASFNWKWRPLLQRLANFLRPAPRYMPLNVKDLISNASGLELVNGFNDICYTGGVFQLNWRGAELLKNPCDLFMSIQLFQKIRPTCIIETGTHHGGSALFYADICKVLGLKTRIITIDINPKWSINPETMGISSVVGFSTDAKVYQRVVDLVTKVTKNTPGPVMVFLDSNHSCENVLEELRLYGRLVTPNSYCVVEDTNVNGHPSFADHGPGPWEAVEKFLQEDSNFVVDKSCERFLLTFNPNGWLLRN